MVYYPLLTDFEKKRYTEAGKKELQRIRQQLKELERMRKTNENMLFITIALPVVIVVVVASYRLFLKLF